MMRFVALLFFLATILATSHGSNRGLSFQNFPLRMKTESDDDKVHCPSWRLGVEAHNIIGWETVPKECGGYVKNYILGEEYEKDSKAVTDQAYSHAKDYAKNHKIGEKDIWVFDIDETVLSNQDFYAKYDYGVEKSDPLKFFEWVVNGGKAKVLPASYALYNKLRDEFHIKIVFLTGRPNNLPPELIGGKNVTKITEDSLKDLGYSTWEKLILIDYDFDDKDKKVSVGAAKEAARKKLEEKEKYRIIGNMGDQWSDILGDHAGNRTFKLPNPMYYSG